MESPVKPSTTQSIKFAKLKRRLKLCHWQAVGVLESIWLFTQLNSPGGNIGKLSNEDIAAGIEWDGDADEFVEAMIAIRFFDVCPVNRLIIHDWEEHCPTWVKGNMVKYGKKFAHIHTSPKDGPKEPPKEPRINAPNVPATATEQAPTCPIQSSPDETISAKPKRERKKRERNPLFDAIAEVTGADVKVNAGHIAKVAAILVEATPPYTPDDVRRFARDLCKLCDWGRKAGRKIPTIGEIQNHIYLIRINPGKTDKPFGDAPTPEYVPREERT